MKLFKWRRNGFYVTKEDYSLIAYKLVRLKKDRTIGSLFIHRQDSLPLNTWIEAVEYPTNGFAVRKGWH